MHSRKPAAGDLTADGKQIADDPSRVIRLRPRRSFAGGAKQERKPVIISADTILVYILNILMQNGKQLCFDEDRS